MMHVRNMSLVWWHLVCTWEVFCEASWQCVPPKRNSILQPSRVSRGRLFHMDTIWLGHLGVWHQPAYGKPFRRASTQLCCGFLCSFPDRTGMKASFQASSAPAKGWGIPCPRPTATQGGRQRQGLATARQPSGASSLHPGLGHPPWHSLQGLRSGRVTRVQPAGQEGRVLRANWRNRAGWSARSSGKTMQGSPVTCG